MSTPHVSPPYGSVSGVAGIRTDASATCSRDVSVRDLKQLIKMRWSALAVHAALIGYGYYVFGNRLPLLAMISVAVALTLFNLALLIRALARRNRLVHNSVILFSLIVSVAGLTIQLYLSGGIGNPFVFLYLLPLAAGALLLRRHLAWILLAIVTACVTGLAVFPGPLEFPNHPHHDLSDPYLQGLLVCLLLAAVLMVVYLRRIVRLLREHDKQLAEARHLAAEEDHMARMGLLATGAAHELGSPLSTLSVILEDWQRLQAVASDPELTQDVVEMQTQIIRCKSIVGDILQSVGHLRGEATLETTLHTYFYNLAEEWRNAHFAHAFEYVGPSGEDVPIVTDVGLHQIVFNALDNALEASPGWVGMSVTCQDGWVQVEVRDRGPGFDPAVLSGLGTPYLSTKPGPQRGLGLFLSINVARTLGRTVTAYNQQGAVILIRFPLSALAMDDEHAFSGTATPADHRG